MLCEPYRESLEDKLAENEVGLYFYNFSDSDTRKHRTMKKNLEFAKWLSSTHSVAFPAMRVIIEGRYYALEVNFDMWLWCGANLNELQMTHKFTKHYRGFKTVEPRNPYIDYDDSSIV
jgi:hypothetical protein